MEGSPQTLSLFARLLVHAYRFVSAYSRPFLQLHLWRRQFSPGKEHADPLRRAERWGFLPDTLASLNQPRLPAQTRLWFHTASVGESLSILPLLKNLRSQMTPEKLQIIVTCCTATADDILRRRLADSGIDNVFAPVDHPEAVSRFLDTWNPTGAVWVESELWPNMIMETSRRRIPMVLINGRMSDKSFKRWTSNSIFTEIASYLLRYFQVVICQSTKDKNKFSQFGTNPLFFGNLKNDEFLINNIAKPTLSSSDISKSIELQQIICDRPVWLAASTHELEEIGVISAHISLQQKYPNLLTIIAPRHPERAPDINHKCESMKLKCVSRSSREKPDESTQIYVVDTIGEMLSLYNCIDVVFMGGSLFLKYGGHNPIEPSFMRCIVLHGPHVSNFTDIYSSMQKHFYQVSDEADLAAKVGQLLDMKTANFHAIESLKNATYQDIAAQEDPCKHVAESLFAHFNIDVDVSMEFVELSFESNSTEESSDVIVIEEPPRVRDTLPSQASLSNSSDSVFQTQPPSPRPVANSSRAVSAAGDHTTLESTQQGAAHSSAEAEEDDATICVICQNPWANTGRHRVVSLPCGHLFGSSCIEVWYAKSKPNACPTCGVQSRLRDIRPIFAPCIKNLACPELENLKMQMGQEKERFERLRKEIVSDIKKLESSVNFLEMEILANKEPRRQLPNPESDAQVDQSQRPSTLFDLFAGLPLKPTGEIQIENGRLMDLNSNSHSLSTSSTKGEDNFGVTMLSLHDPRYRKYIRLHSKEVKDIRFHPTDPTRIATCSFDKNIKIVHHSSASIVANIPTDSPCWSLAWDTCDELQIMCGLSNGYVSLFDLKKVGEPLRRIHVSKFPVRSLDCVPIAPEHKMHIMAGSSSGLSFWNKDEGKDDAPLHSYPVKGNCIAVSYDPSSQLVVACSRLNSEMIPNYTIVGVNDTVKKEEIHASPQNHRGLYPHVCINRHLAFTRQGTNYLAYGGCSHNEVSIYDITNHEKKLVQTLSPHPSVVLDVRQDVGNSGIISTLCDKEIRIYRSLVG